MGICAGGMDEAAFAQAGWILRGKDGIMMFDISSNDIREKLVAENEFRAGAEILCRI